MESNKVNILLVAVPKYFLFQEYVFYLSKNIKYLSLFDYYFFALTSYICTHYCFVCEFCFYCLFCFLILFSLAAICLLGQWHSESCWLFFACCRCRCLRWFLLLSNTGALCYLLISSRLGQKFCIC